MIVMRTPCTIPSSKVLNKSLSKPTKQPYCAVVCVLIIPLFVLLVVGWDYEANLLRWESKGTLHRMCHTRTHTHVCALQGKESPTHTQSNSSSSSFKKTLISIPCVQWVCFSVQMPNVHSKTNKQINKNKISRVRKKSIICVWSKHTSPSIYLSVGWQLLMTWYRCCMALMQGLECVKKEVPPRNTHTTSVPRCYLCSSLSKDLERIVWQHHNCCFCNSWKPGIDLLWTRHKKFHPLLRLMILPRTQSSRLSKKMWNWPASNEQIVKSTKDGPSDGSKEFESSKSVPLN